MVRTDWERLVTERNTWVAHNFPGDNEPNSTLGVIEECGELAHAHLKQKQGIRGDDEKHVEDAQDAIGDLTVYLLGCMVAMDSLPHEDPWEMPEEPPLEPADTDKLILQIGKHVGWLCSQGVGLRLAAISMLPQDLEWYCAARGWDYDAIVKDTWHGVSQRDWIVYPGDGLTH